MNAPVDDVSDLLIALVTAHRTGMSSREVNALLEASLSELARTAKQREWVLTYLTGSLVAHLAAALNEWDRTAGRPVSQQWIAAIVELAAEQRASP
ncbi:hypothetical protein [Nonomuraea sp. NPDC049646]|uniref:hypothetical protein n=1 Tax=unclassified Nonomuraea TaxID=2593643 RepID=UPI0037AA4A03